MDLSKLPDNELKAIATGDMSGVSDDTLKYIAQGGTGAYRQTQGKPDATPAEVAAMRDKFIRDEGTPGTRIRQSIPAARKGIADFIRPTLEGGGMVLTAIGGPAVEGVGYAAGKRIADLVEGKPDPVYTDNPWLNPFLAAAQDAKDGATMAMGGRVVGKALEAAAPYISKAPDYIPGTRAYGERKAAEKFTKAMTPASPELAAKYAENAARTGELNTDLPYPFTPGQTTGKDAVLSMEHRLANSDDVLRDTLKERNLQNAIAANRNLSDAFPEGQPLPELQAPEITGAAQREATQALRSASQQGVTQDYNAISKDYIHPTDNLEQTIQTVEGKLLTPKAREALDMVKAVLKDRPRDTGSLVELDQYLSDLGRSHLNDDASVYRLTKWLRKGLDEQNTGLMGDFQAMGEAAKNGDIAVHVDPATGTQTLVTPSKIQGEIARLQEQAAQTAAQGATPKEQANHLYKYLVDNGHGLGMSPAVNRSEADWLAKMRAELQHQQSQGKLLDYTPPTGTINQSVADNIQNGIAAKQAILDNLQPAEDVAAQYAKAHASALEHQQKFGGSVVKKVLNYGDMTGGSQMELGNVPQALFTREGAKQAVNALGIERASGLATPHVEALLFDPAKGAMTDGVLDLTKAVKVIKDNQSALDTLGLTRHAKQLAIDQIGATIRADLAKVGQMNPDNPAMSALQAARWARTNAKALEFLTGDNSAAKDLWRYAETMRVLARRPKVLGSDTAINMAKDIPPNTRLRAIWDNLNTVITGAVTGGYLHGWEGAMVGGTATAVAKGLSAHSNRIATELLTDAITNPATAKILNKLGRGTKITLEEAKQLIGSVNGMSPEQINAGKNALYGYTGGVLTNPTSN